MEMLSPPISACAAKSIGKKQYSVDLDSSEKDSAVVKDFELHLQNIRVQEPARKLRNKSVQFRGDGS